MTTYTRPLSGGTPTTGQVVKAVHVNDPIDQIYDTILAGGITADQIATGAVDTSELATAAVTAAKMDGTLPDASAMATSTAPTLDKELANKKYVDDEITTAKTDVGFTFDGTQIFDSTCPTTFTDLDVAFAASITAQRMLVHMRIRNFGTAETFQFRTNGDTEDVGAGINDSSGTSVARLNNNNLGYITVLTDSNGIIEWQGLGAKSVDIFLLGFWVTQ